MSARPGVGRLVLLGHPVAHSLSPLFQNAALRSAGIPLTYEALDVAPSDLAGVLPVLREQNAAGNATIPHKEALFQASGRRTAIAERAGAVNTFWHEQGVLVGDNTDVGGFTRAVIELLDAEPSGITVGVLGAGGAARGVLAAIEQWAGCRALVHNRTAKRAEELVARFGSVAQLSDAGRIGREAQLVVNATPVGLHDEALPIAIEPLRRDAVLFDLVYRRGETAFVRGGRASGRRAADGLCMLLEQGALAFERWFGVAPDRQVMRKAVML